MERSPCTLSDEELAGRLHRLLAESDLQSTTTRELRSKLEEETSSCLNHRKQFIKSEVDRFLIGSRQGESERSLAATVPTLSGACELSPALLEALTSIWQALSTHSNATTSEFPTSKPKVLELLWRYIHFRKLGAPPVRRTDGISVSTIRLDKILAEVFRDPLDCYSLVAQLCQHMRPQRAGLVPLVDGASVAGSVPLVDGASVAGSLTRDMPWKTHQHHARRVDGVHNAAAARHPPEAKMKNQALPCRKKEADHARLLKQLKRVQLPRDMPWKTHQHHARRVDGVHNAAAARHPPEAKMKNQALPGRKREADHARLLKQWKRVQLPRDMPWKTHQHHARRVDVHNAATARHPPEAKMKNQALPCRKKEADHARLLKQLKRVQLTREMPWKTHQHHARRVDGVHNATAARHPPEAKMKNQALPGRKKEADHARLLKQWKRVQLPRDMPWKTHQHHARRVDVHNAATARHPPEAKMKNQALPCRKKEADHARLKKKQCSSPEMPWKTHQHHAWAESTGVHNATHA
ncbi:hypothetical protein CYMTET_40633 [Cymbomonas tetramitiformis]|uniref:DEK-C domain-containing protein n=1 Tax=Cymbomonas tetramitiformis TaxID=36881 RepID=A0AAE0F2S7_9CHLO|nr:hypothetical protein CYMTET_40633 [Cymbomonas tetramitiformis]